MGGGAPPASKEAVTKLKKVKITSKEIEEKAECSVCKDEYELDDEVKVMPCSHRFHIECIDPWLKLRNSCPVCRYELPTDDTNYENKKKKKPSNSENSNEGNNNQNNNMDDDDHDEMGFPRNSNSNNRNNYYI